MAKVLDALIKFEVSGSNKSKNLIQSFEELDNQTDKLKINFKSLTSNIISTAKRIDELTSYTDKFITSQRILNQTFGNSTKSINEYIGRLSYMTGVSETNISKATAWFGQMATSLGMSTGMAENFSKQLDTLSAKMSLLYNIDYERSAKALVDAVKGESSTLTTLTGIVVKTQSLQNTLNELGINLEASKLSGVNLAMLQYITVAKQINVTNGELSKTVNDVAWQKRMLTQQIQRLSNAFGNLLYPIIRTILPYLNAILIVLTEIINTFARLIGWSGELSTGLTNTSNAFDGLAGSIKKTANASKQLRGFDKLNNITTPTTADTSGGAGGINADLYKALQEADKQMLDIRNKAQEIAESILKWLGFSKDIDGQWQFSKVTLGTVLTTSLLILKAFKTLYTISQLLSKLKLFDFLGSGLIGAEVGKITEGIALWIGGAGTFGEAFTEIILPALGTIATIIGTVLLAVGGIFETIQGIHDIKLGEKFKGVLSIVEGIALIVGAILLAFVGWIPALIAVGVALVTEVIKRSEKLQEIIKNVGIWVYDNIISPIWEFWKNIAIAIWSVASKIIEIGAKIMEIFIAIGKAFYEYVVKPIWDNFLQPLFSKIYNAVIKPVIDALKSIGNTVVTFMWNTLAGTINGIFVLIENKINGFIHLLNSAIDKINKIPGVNISAVKDISLPRLQLKAEGGFLSSGEMYIARENGISEMIGRIGNKGAVANNDQITQGIASAVYKANMASQSKQPKRPVEITAEGDISGLLNFIKFKEKEQDRQYGF